MKILLKLTVASALMLLASSTGAIPIYYFYEGANFTENYFWSQGEEIQIPAQEQPSGFRLTDRIRGFLLLDTENWGQGEISSGGVTGEFTSGPFSIFDSVRITLSLLGEVEFWNISGASPGMDLAIGGTKDGPSSDIIFGDRWSEGRIAGSALVSYPPGSPSRWTMTPVSVPDAGATLLLLAIGIAPLLVWVPFLRVRA